MRLLLVDDEARLVDALAAGLRAEGFAVDVARTGPAGLEAARGGDHDAIVLDLMLPGMSGYRVLQALRAEGVWAPVLLLSAKDGEHDQADGLDLGADDYLTKPFSYVVLLARLRALLRRGAAPRPAVLAVGDLTMDPATRVVARAGAPVDLTAREFSLLELLMRRGGEVVSKLELIDHVWDSPGASDVNVVEVYVGYVRRKVDAPFGRHSVVTVRGAGYRLVDDRADEGDERGQVGARGAGRAGGA